MMAIGSAVDARWSFVFALPKESIKVIGFHALCCDLDFAVIPPVVWLNTSLSFTCIELDEFLNFGRFALD
jgi:hypothetical protein